jgi:hypothetical protein
VQSHGDDLAEALAAVQEATARVREAQATLGPASGRIDLALRETTAHLEAARRVLFLAEVNLVGAEETLPA